MPRGKPGEWQTISARPIQRVQRDRIADELVTELRELQEARKDEPPGEHDGLSVSRTVGDTIIKADLDLLDGGGITIIDCQIRRRKVIEPEKVGTDG